MSLPPITFSTVAKLLVASFIVGMTLAYFEIRPEDLLFWIREKMSSIAQNFSAYGQWTIKYILLGAVVVVPLWVLIYLWRMFRK